MELGWELGFDWGLTGFTGFLLGSYWVLTGLNGLNGFLLGSYWVKWVMTGS